MKKLSLIFLVAVCLVIGIWSLGFPPKAEAATYTVTEEFTSTTSKDAAATTAIWDTQGGGKVRLPLNVNLAGSCSPVSYSDGICVSGNYAYVAARSAGLKIVNISNPASPTLAGTYDTPDIAFDVKVSGNYAYVADGDTGLVIINISNPASPTLAGSYNTPGSAYGVYVSGNYAYVADADKGLRIINVSNPGAPFLAGFYDTAAGSAWGVYVSGNYAYMGDDTNGFRIINVSNPAAPFLAGFYNTPDNPCWGVYVSGNYAYVADAGAGLLIFNVSNPASPTLAGSYNTTGTATRVYVSGNYAYVADDSSGLEIINISNPASPTLAGFYDTPGTARGVYVSGNYDYVGDGDSGLQIIYTTFECLTPKAVQSTTVGSTSTNISKATLTATQTLNDGAVSYEMSANGGANWENCTSGTELIFTNPGTSLKWRADLSTTDIAKTPEIDRVAIAYVFMKTFYVDSASPEGGSGTQASPFKTINSAEAAASSGDEIHVKQGTYSLAAPGTGTITLKSGVYLRGGYKPTDWLSQEADPSKTIISGESTVRCMSGEALTAATTIENFTIKNGSSESGGGLSLKNSSPTITNCTFTSNNGGTWGGGGIYNYTSSSPEIQNCTFTSNEAYGGGGIRNDHSCSPIIKNCTFTSNIANSTGGNGGGGGIRNHSYSSPTIKNCTFTSNSSASWGGGIYNEEYASPTIQDCTFISNNAGSGGGGIKNEYYSSPPIQNCTFTSNSAPSGWGGGIRNDTSSPPIQNCTFTLNNAGTGGGMFNYSSSSPTIKNSIIYGNTGGSIYNSSSSATVEYSCIQDGYTGTGNISTEPKFVSTNEANPQFLRLGAGSPCIDTASIEAPSPDLANNLRPHGFGNDMGAYEFQGPSVSVEAPNSGETLEAGSVYNIMFNVSPEADAIKIRLSTNGGSIWNTPITDETKAYSGISTYEWTVNDLPSTECMISIEALDNSIWNYDASNSTFEIVARGPKTFYVDSAFSGVSDGSQASPFKTINSAEAAASSGDEIHVKQGTYSLAAPGTGTITLKSGVYLRGGYNGSWNQTSEASTTIISGEGTIQCMSGEGLTAATTIENFTIRNGNPGMLNSGGGLYLTGSSPTIQNCTFTSNSGGGIWNYRSSSTITNCTFTSNEATYNGGGICNTSSSPEVQNCTFTSNSGGGIRNTSSSPEVQNCTFTSNSGGGIRNTSSPPTITNCTFTSNSGGGIWNNISSPTITNCTFTSNSGGGISNITSSPTIQNCAFTSNEAAVNGGGIWNNISSPTITNCTFTSNSAGNDGGGIWNWDSSSPTITNCTFTSNSAGHAGGGIYNVNSSSPTITNCTFTLNNADLGGGGIVNNSSSPTIKNSIIYGNTATNWPNIYGTANVTYSCIQGGYEGTGNISAEPKFVSTNEANPQFLRLGAGSPCIDTASTEAPSPDLAGKTRPHGLGNDMGAYEFQGPSAPTGLVTTNTTTNSASSTWEAPAGNPASYIISYGTDESAANLGTKSTTEASYSWTDLDLATIYYWKVSATNEAGEGPYSSIASFETLAAPAATPEAADFSAVTVNAITANWTANGNPSGTQYQCENITKPATSGWITDTSWESTGLSSNTSYTFRVKARNGNNIETGWMDLGPCFTRVTTPTGLTATPTNEAVDLSWLPNPESIKEYRIYRDGAQIAAPTASPYNDPSLTNNTTYTYKCKAIATNDNWSDFSSTIEATPRAPDVVAASPETFVIVPDYPGVTIEINPDGSADTSFEFSHVKLHTSVPVTGETVTIEKLTKAAMPTYEGECIGSDTVPKDNISEVYYYVISASSYLKSKLVSTEVGLSYNTVEVAGKTGLTEEALRIYKYTNNDWHDITSRVDTGNKEVVGTFEGTDLCGYAILTLLPPPISGPAIEAIWINGIRFRSGDIISSNVSIEALISSEAAVTNAQLWVDGGIVTTWLGGWIPPHIRLYGTFKIPTTSQRHILDFRLQQGIYGISSITMEARVMAGAVQVIGRPNNYPNPFSPMTGGSTTIQYTLSTDATITIIIYDITGHEVKRMKFSSGTAGGRGGTNQAAWDGRSLGREVVGNGMYLYKIISGNEVIGSGKLVVFE